MYEVIRRSGKLTIVEDADVVLVFFLMDNVSRLNFGLLKEPGEVTGFIKIIEYICI